MTYTVSGIVVARYNPRKRVFLYNDDPVSQCLMITDAHEQSRRTITVECSTMGTAEDMMTVFRNLNMEDVGVVLNP